MHKRCSARVNVRVHAITRQARPWPDGFQGVVGDANDPASLAGAAAGIDWAFLMSGYAAEAQLLADLGAGHAALLSSSSVPRADSGNAMAAYHRDSEEAVKASVAPWTIVRPCSMQSNVTRAGRISLTRARSSAPRSARSLSR
jgi:uncharacterized protein YbjT (DUF2867 family)